MAPVSLACIHPTRNTVSTCEQNRHHIHLISTYFVASKFASVYYNVSFTLGALNIKKCRLVVIDWHWKDKKMRTIVDIPEIKDDLSPLLRDIVVPCMQSNKLKLFLY